MEGSIERAGAGSAGVGHSGATAAASGPAAIRFPVLVTGSSGFIGTNLLLALRRLAPRDAVDTAHGDATEGTPSTAARAQIIAVDRVPHKLETWLAAGLPLPGCDECDGADGSSAAADSSAAPGTWPAIVFEDGDILDEDGAWLAGVVARHRPRTVLHLAALAGVRPSLRDPAAYMRCNVDGTRAVLEAALGQQRRMGGDERVTVVSTSSSSVYGVVREAAVRDDSAAGDADAAAATPTATDGTTSAAACIDTRRVPNREGRRLQPLSPYAVSKARAEQLCHAYAQRFGLNVAIVRPHNVYGPWGRADTLIPKLLSLFDAAGITAGSDGRKGGSRASPSSFSLYGDGQLTRDFTYVGDVVAGMIAAAAYAGPSGVRDCDTHSAYGGSTACALQSDAGGAGPTASAGAGPGAGAGATGVPDEPADYCCGSGAARIYNLGTGSATSLNDLMELLARALHVSRDALPVTTVPDFDDVHEPRHTLADVRHPEAEIGWRARVDLVEGLQRTVAWDSQHRQRRAGRVPHVTPRDEARASHSSHDDSAAVKLKQQLTRVPAPISVRTVAGLQAMSMEDGVAALGARARGASVCESPGA